MPRVLGTRVPAWVLALRGARATPQKGPMLKDLGAVRAEEKSTRGHRRGWALWPMAPPKGEGTFPWNPWPICCFPFLGVRVPVRGSRPYCPPMWRSPCGAPVSVARELSVHAARPAARALSPVPPPLPTQATLVPAGPHELHWLRS